jgi:hypothetical protein
MAYGRDTFLDPTTGETYPWPVNHSEESTFGKTRQINSGANTGNTGLTIQQGDDEPMILELTGTIVHKSQHDQFVRWFAISRGHTIHFIDFTGDRYEVLITAFLPQRQRTIGNPRDRSIRLHYWTYTLRMQVVTFVSGAWTAVTP